MPVGNRSGGARYFCRLVLFVAVVAASGWLFYRYGPDGLEFEWLMKPQFNAANSFYHGVAWVQEKEGGPYKLIDKKGSILVKKFSADYVSSNPYSSDLASFTVDIRKHGYVDLTGRVVVPAQYEFTGMIKDGVGVVRSGDLFGVIDEKGRTVLPIMYEEFICDFSANLFGVKSGDKWGYVNGRNEAVTDFVFDEPSTPACPRGTCVAVLNGKSGLLDERGRWVLPASYDAIYDVVPGEAEDNPKIGVCRDGKVGFVDLQGNTVIDFLFENPIRHVSGWTDCYQFSEGLSSVMLSNPESGREAFGVIDETGKVLFRFSEVPRDAYHEGYMVVEDEHENYSLLDRTGKAHPLPAWLEIWGERAVVNGTLPVRVRQKTQWYEKRKIGYLKIPPQ